MIFIIGICPYNIGILYLYFRTWPVFEKNIIEIKFFKSMDVRVGLWRRLSTEELMHLNCGVGEDPWESLGLQGDPSSSSNQSIQPVHQDHSGNWSWIFTGKTDVEIETPVLWPPDVKSWLIRKDPDAWKDWRHEEKGTTEDEMAGWHHWLNGHEFE